MSRKTKTILVATLLIAILTLSIGYAALSSSLKIKGTASVTGEKWEVRFVKNESTESGKGQAECDIGTIEDTSITNLSARFKVPGDSCIFTVPVENTGTLSASLVDVIGKETALIFNGNTEDQAILDSNVEYSVNYGGTEINDKTEFENIYTLEPGEKETITLKVTFNSEATKVPKTSVEVKGLDRTFVFENKTSTTDPTAETKYSVKYEGFSSTGFKTRVQKGDTFTQKIGENITLCSVKMNGVALSNSQYTFENGVITIENVTGNIIINGGIDGPAKETPVTTPNPPELNGDMIPVYYDEKEAKWKKADKDNNNSNWYDYTNQKWANAVTIISDKRDDIKNAKAGTIIPMNYINTMWVWIPRYSYTIRKDVCSNLLLGKGTYGNDNPTRLLPGEIDVKFIKTTENDNTGTAQYTGSTATNWRTNEAFNFGGEAKAGIWVGKFEITGSYTETCKDETCNVSGVTVLPNTASIRDQAVSSFFYMARSMQTNNSDTYGFDRNKGDLHMMKNDEWGAVAYLSQSRYGKYGNKDYSGANKEVYINNSSSYITGTSGGGPSVSSSGDHYEYNDMKDLGQGKGQAGPGASTTGTIYGVYDMSGGAYEYVMGVLEYDSQTESEHQGAIATYSSEFKGLSPSGSSTGTVELPDEKYYNIYKSADPTSDSFANASTACSGGVCYGHALSETYGATWGYYGWYHDYVYFVYRFGPWFVRGGEKGRGSDAGVFGADYFYGNSSSGYSSRLVLVG